MGGNGRNDFTFENASSHFIVHPNLSFLFRAAKKRKALLLAHDRKRDKVVRRPMSCYTYLTLVGFLIVMTA